MKVYRIAHKDYIEDLSGEGARLYGGRWNRKGTSLLYVSESRSLAALEYLVHLPMNLVPKNISIAEILLPSRAEYDQIQVNSLPADWSNYPAPLELADRVGLWLDKNITLYCKVPSSVVEGDCNILINPKHPKWTELKITDLKPFLYDKRIMRK